MPSRVRRIGRAVAGLAAEDRSGFKRIDASPALPDDGAWLKPKD
jgi:hypothetical protein